MERTEAMKIRYMFEGALISKYGKPVLTQEQFDKLESMLPDMLKTLQERLS